MKKQTKKKHALAEGIQNFQLGGSLELVQDGQPSSIGEKRMALLEAIDTTGSISAAARKVGLSYKGAWDALNDMNNQVGSPLLITSVGGQRGGGARLTDEAHKMLQVFQVVQKEHKRFLERAGQSITDFDKYYKYLRKIAVKTSARNQIQGKITGIEKGAVNSLVTLSTGDDEITASITNESLNALGLRKGSEAFALIKATQLILGIGDARLSTRNQLKGIIEDLHEGPVHVEVNLKLKGGTIITTIITRSSMEDLGIKKGSEATVYCKASSVILGVTG